MIPIRLGTVSILRLVVSLGLINTLVALILVYTAMGLPLTIFVLQQFMRQVPSELKAAARGRASEYRIFWLVLPLVAPAVATVAVFTMIPIWNDLWFPLILAPENRPRRSPQRAAVSWTVCERLECRPFVAHAGHADHHSLPDLLAPTSSVG